RIEIELSAISYKKSVRKQLGSVVVGSSSAGRWRVAERDDQENVESGETGHGTGAAADERKPVDGASGIRRGKRARGTSHVPDGREGQSQAGSWRGTRRDSGGAGGYDSGDCGLYDDTERHGDRHRGAEH